MTTRHAAPLPRAPAPAAWHRYVEQRARHRRFAVLAGLAAVLAAAVIGGALLQLDRPRAAGASAVAIGAWAAWAVLQRRPRVDAVGLFVDLALADEGQVPRDSAVAPRPSAAILRGPWPVRETPRQAR
jgi:hypothetical protein